MKIEWTQIKNEFDGKYCYTHARAAKKADGEWILTTQPLLLSGVDVFYGIELRRSKDGVNWTPPTKSRTLVRRKRPDGFEEAMCDATPFLHRSTGKLILTGHVAIYNSENKVAEGLRRSMVYAVYDEETGDFTNYKELPIKGDVFYSAGAGSTQILEHPSGDLLIPIYFNDYAAACDPWHSCSMAAVMRCAFDGKTLTLKEIGNALSTPVPRGLGEPSIACYAGAYFLALRNDETGFVARSADGLHFSDPTPLVFDDGENVGNYNTQQHWITGGGKLYLVYTRKGAGNDHVFRHRAPLFIAEFDPERTCLIRDTERIAVPERGARLGNFSCFIENETSSYVVAAEWMQSIKGKDYRYCMEFGSDNSIFLSHVTFE